MSTLHADLTGTQLHAPFQYEQDADPGAVGAGMYWLDTGEDPHTLKRRNSGDTDWVDVGASNGSSKYNLDDAPGSPNALDDEFEGGGSINVKWTATNNPAGGDAFSQADFEGYLHVGLPENTGTDNFDATVRLHQTPPTGTQAMTYIAKIALGMVADAFQTEKGEFARVGIYLGNSTNDEFVMAGVEYNNALESGLNITIVTGVTEDGNMSSLFAVFVDPTEFLYVKLEKTTTNAYNAANTYNCYFSRNGIVWQLVASESKTFTTNCDEVGILCRRPKSQNGAPKAEATVDFFRRTV